MFLRGLPIGPTIRFVPQSPPKRFRWLRIRQMLRGGLSKRYSIVFEGAQHLLCRGELASVKSTWLPLAAEKVRPY